jgi:trigger factor
VKLDGFVRGQGLKFSCDFEIIPPIPEIDFSRIAVEKPVAKAGDREVDEAIRNIAESRHSTEELKTPRKTRKGDIAVIDFEGFEGGKPFEGGSGSDYPLELGSGSFIPGFEDQLVGRSKGDSLDVGVTFPKDYGHEALAGKKAVFKVAIKNVKEKIVPAIDDAFAKELKREDLADLRRYVKTLLEQNYENSAKSIVKDRLLDELAREKVEVPSSLVEQEVEYMLASHSHDHSKMTEKEMAKERDGLRKSAESRVKLGLILADVGRREKIEVSQNDVQQAVMREAVRYPDQSRQVFEYYSKNRGAADALRAGIFEDKVLDFVLSKIRVKEKTVKPDELSKKK